MKRKLNADGVPEASPSDDKVTHNPTPKNTFSNLGLDARLLQALQQQRLATPTPVQSKAIPPALSGKDVLAKSKTGSGKTLAYVLPLLNTLLRHNSTGTRRDVKAVVLVPTKDLASQVLTTIHTFNTPLKLTAINLSRKEDDSVTRARLAETPDIIVGTPARVDYWLNQPPSPTGSTLNLEGLKWLVIDEVDLVLSFGYETDLRSIASALPRQGVQTMMLSATLPTTVTSTLTTLFCRSDTLPTILDLSAQEAKEKQLLSHHYVFTPEEDKFLLVYAIFKLKLLRGKTIVFVTDVDRCYRVKLFLEQFGVRSCVLNHELPVNSRVHVVQEFNSGVYDILIAADEGEVSSHDNNNKKRVNRLSDTNDENADKANPTHDSDVEEEEEEEDTSHHPPKPTHTPSESSTARGIDFRNISCVLNFDLPSSAKSYTHRVGRTARAGRTGMALSFVVPKAEFGKSRSTSVKACAGDEEVLGAIRSELGNAAVGTVDGSTADLAASPEPRISEWQFDKQKLEPFRYRFQTALANVTRLAIRETRTRELKRELLNSAKLQRHFEENPDELAHLRLKHDGDGNSAAGGRVRVLGHLKHVPEYLLPKGGVRQVGREVGFVGLRGDGNKRERKVGRTGKGGVGKKGRSAGGDPLRSLRVDGGVRRGNGRGRGRGRSGGPGLA